MLAWRWVFAVIAPIFSIAEDALFPGTTSFNEWLFSPGWQPMANLFNQSYFTNCSPGIFSAVMIGFGRAVGETMIVLMATGNTAVMEWNIFEGMRTLSANVAVEMGETETVQHTLEFYFLSALSVVVLTFILNTVAEVVEKPSA